MKSILSLLFVLTCYSNAGAQPYQIGHVSITFTDPARGNRAVPTEIYYPADVTADNATFTSAITGPVPAISFGHGFVMAWNAYQNIWEAVAGAGYIIAFPTTEGSLSPNHGTFGEDLRFVLQQLKAQGNLASSVLYNRVDTVTCVMGHSMGGGAAFLAAAADPTIKAIATLAPAETSPGAISAAGTIATNALVIAGANDCVTPPATNQVPMYNNLLSACKHYIAITGGSHCQMAESNAACNFGESTCTPAPAISRATQHTIINRYLLPWLSSRLKNSCTAGRQFDSTLNADGEITYQKNCALCSGSGIAGADNSARVSVYPNPFGAVLHVRTPGSAEDEFVLYNVTGKIMRTTTADSTADVSTADLASGVYFYEVRSAAVVVKRGIVVKQ
jgi:predicted dienelactone hydrolase